MATLHTGSGNLTMHATYLGDRTHPEWDEAAFRCIATRGKAEDAVPYKEIKMIKLWLEKNTFKSDNLTKDEAFKFIVILISSLMVEYYSD